MANELGLAFPPLTCYKSARELVEGAPGYGEGRPMVVRLHPHARERIIERGATEEEVKETVRSGDLSGEVRAGWIPATFPIQ